MPHPNAQPIILPMPTKGVDQGSTFAAQPPGTCPDARNVRALDIRNRLGVGKRNGHSKAFTTQIGSVANGRRINSLGGFSNSIAELGGAGTPEEVEFDSAAIPTGDDLGDGWIQVARIGEANPEAGTFLTITGSQLRFGTNINGSISGVTPQNRTNNSVTATYLFNGQADATGTFSPNTVEGSVDGPDLSCPLFGVFIRGNALLTDCICLHFRRTGANQVAIRLSSRISGTYTAISTSSNFTLDGLATQTVCTMRLTEISSSQIEAEVVWAAQGIAFTTTYNTTTANSAGHERSGICHVAGSANIESICTAINTTIFAATEPTVALQVNATDPNPVGANQFFVPSSWASVYDDSGAVTSATGPTDSATIFAGCSVDDTNDEIMSGNSVFSVTGATGPDACMLTQPSNPSVRRAVAVVCGAHSSVQFLAYTRVSDDFKSYIKIRVNATRDATTHQIEISEIDWVVVENGAITKAEADFFTTAGPSLVCRDNDQIVIVDSGENGASTFSVLIKGYTLFTASLSAARVSQANSPLLYDGSNVSWRRLGAGTGASTSIIDSIKLVDAGLAPAGGTASEGVGVNAFYVAAFTNSQISVGTLASGLLTSTSGTTFASSLAVYSAPLLRKLYCVNGTDSIVVDPINATSVNWAPLVTEGALPLGCQLACTYRGRVVIARQVDNPSIWYMSRQLDPYDWDFGAEPAETAAVAGTNAEVGQPGDAIVALVPFSDDYLFFMCASSIWMMEGDPGYGGQVQNASSKTGIVGGRAWCIDAHGNLWFVGQAGLYRILRGQLDPENMSGDRLTAYIDDVNADTTLIQLAYDAGKDSILITLTPTAGTAGVHVIYDIDRDGFWLDEYPSDFGPWSVLETDGVLDIDRRYIFGCNDGYIRRQDEDVTSDDTTSIDSWVRLTPIEEGGGVSEGIMVEMHGEVAKTTTGALAWYWITSESPNDVNAIAFATAVATPTNSGQWDGSAANTAFQAISRIRQRAPAHQLILRQSSSTLTWAIERVAVFFAAAGRRRLA